MYNFCTLFDSNFLSRGLALYDSLSKKSDDFCLYVLCMDDKTFKVLNSLNVENIILISLNEFEDEKLQSIKKTRTRGEYCWTCTPFLIKYILENYQVKDCTYLDADLYFFESPKAILEEFYASGKSALITEHRYTPEYDQSTTSGIYCVQFMTFKNNEDGNGILNWWADRCFEWCFNRYEDGKFGDQKYLDDWLIRFEGKVHNLEHVGGGIAPWNIQQYKITDSMRIDGYSIVFYHFHQLNLISRYTANAGIYKLSEEVIKNIYVPYIECLDEQVRKISCIDKSINFYSYFETDTQNILLSWLEWTEERFGGFDHSIMLNNKIGILGTDKVAKVLFQQMTKQKLNVTAFIKSKLDLNEANFLNTPIIEVDNLNKLNQLDVIIVTILGNHDKNIIKQIEEKLEQINKKIYILSWKELIYSDAIYINYEKNRFKMIKYNNC